jgi:hypothetical protein
MQGHDGGRQRSGIAHVWYCVELGVVMTDHGVEESSDSSHEHERQEYRVERLGISPQRGVDTLCLSKSKRMYHIPKADMGFIYLHISNTITRITYPISNIYLHAIYSIDTALIPESLHYTSVLETN